MPAGFCVPFQYGSRERNCALLVSFWRLFSGARPPQGSQNAILHLGRGFAREGDGDHFFRIGNDRQQTQVTLDQQFRLARPRRGLDDERARNVERALARLHVVAQQLRVTTHCAAP